MYTFMDYDEYESVVENHPCSCGGTPGSATCVRPGGCNGWASYSLRRRSPDDIARIKAKKRKEHEDAVLAEAEMIKAHRAKEGG